MPVLKVASTANWEQIIKLQHPGTSQLSSTLTPTIRFETMVRRHECQHHTT